MQTQIHQNSSLPANSLSPVQLQVLDLLLAGSTVTEAAEQAQIHRTTIHHWCRVDAVFVAALNAAKERRFHDVNDELRSLSGPALEALRQALTVDKPVAPARLRAALAVLKAIQQDAPRSPAISQHTVALPDAFIETEETQAADLTHPGTFRREGPKIGRNEPCPCGSGLKHKRCCGNSVTPVS